MNMWKVVVLIILVRIKVVETSLVKTSIWLMPWPEYVGKVVLVSSFDNVIYDDVVERLDGVVLWIVLMQCT